MDGRVGMSRPGIGAGPYRSGITLRRFTNDQSPCGPKHNHLFVNRPCYGRNNADDNKDDDTDKKGGGPVIVLGGSPYNLNDKGPSGDNAPHSGDNPPPPGGPQLPNHFEATPEPTYMALTGLVFAAVFTLARKRRVA
jgi:hypothetical protein